MPRDFSGIDPILAGVVYPPPAVPEPRMQWHVVRVRTHHEKPTREEIAALDIETSLPMLLETVRHARKTHVEQRPLFPSYLFARYCEMTTAGWTRIWSRPGVISILRGTMPDRVHAEIALRADRDGVIRERAPLKLAFEPDERVRIDDLDDTNWHGLLGRVLTMRGPERALLLVGALKKEIEVRKLVRA